MRRRDFVAGFGATALVASPRVRAQSRIYRVATLTPVAPVTEKSAFGMIIVDMLGKQGYKLGENLAFEAIGASGQVARLPELVQGLVDRKTDAVVVTGYPTAVALKATSLATICVTGIGDPVATGLVDGLARPGGNITGISDNATTLSTKRLGLLKGSLPSLRKVAMLWNKNDLGMTLRYQASAAAAGAIGVTVQELGIAEPNDFADAFAAMDRDQPEAILMVSDALTNLNRKRVLDYAAEHRLPAIFESDMIVREGGLMSYGADLRESYQRAAALVDRLFKGAQPADLPFEQPTRYLFVVNLKTAKSIGFEFPPNVIALADEVIE